MAKTKEKAKASDKKVAKKDAKKKVVLSAETQKAVKEGDEIRKKLV